ncbi:MAG: hypothetical protein IJU94_01000 [Clostridia bacterium]|nr:hypothetical protein [Clostridia bacterium]
MKKLYKRVLAVVLCLALMAAIVPATAFAWYIPNIPEDAKNGDIVPGVVVVKLKEAYVGNPMELFPYLEIASIEDMYLSVLIVSGKNIDDADEELLKMLGTSLIITLVEESVEAVEKAIEQLNMDNRVLYAHADHVVFATDDPVVNPPSYENEITVGDALKALRVAAGLQEATAELVAAYDTDGDGEITVADALTVLRIAAKLA